MMAVVGHLTVDEILPQAQKQYQTMGGVAAYASIGARLLGVDVRVYSVVGGDFPDRYLNLLAEAGIDISNVIRLPEARTTRFKLSYMSEERVVELLARAPDISLTHVREPNVYLGPVAWEITLDEIPELVSRAGRVALDPQGLMRVAEIPGRITLERKLNPAIFEGLWMLRVSREEARVLTGEENPVKMCRRLGMGGAEITVVSAGSWGLVVHRGGETFKVPAYEVVSRDPTGAGDVMGGAMMAEYIKTGDLEWSAAVGAAAASMSVEGKGPTCLLAENALRIVRERAEQLVKRIEWL